MRPVRKITAEEERFRVKRFAPGMGVIRREPVEPEPVGTLILMAFRIVGYRPDCDGSLMATVEQIDKNGQATGWTENSIGLYPDVDLVLDGPAELARLFGPPDEPEIVADHPQRRGH